MKQRKSYMLSNLEEYTELLYSSKYDFDIFKQTKLSTSMLHEIRRQFGLSTFREALEKYIEVTLRDSVHKSEYESFCSFLMEQGFEDKLTLIPDETLRLKYLKRIKNPHAKAIVLASLSDDEIKKEYLKSFRDEKDRLVIITSLSTDEEKINHLDRITDYHKKASLIASLESDELKIEYIFSGVLHPTGLAEVIASLKNDQTKEELMSLIPSDTARLRIILSIEDENTKKRLYEEKLISETFRNKQRPKLIRSSPIESQLQHFGEYEDGLKYMILKDCDFDTQMKLLPELADASKKSKLFEVMPAEFIFKYMTAHYGDTTNFWVRTDSEEREPNLPRDDREQVAMEIVKFSTIPDANKVELIHTYITDKEKIRELLKEMPYNFVISQYFMLVDGAVDITMLDYIKEVYDIEATEDVTLTAARNFDFDDPQNQDLIARVKNMKYPKFSLNGISYEEYKRWEKVFKDSDVILLARDIDVSSKQLSIDEIRALSDVAEYVLVDHRFITKVDKYCQATELIRDIFPLGEDEKFDSVRDEIEIQLTVSGQIGATLIKAEDALKNAGFTPEETQMYGEKLLAGLYNADLYKYSNLRFALDEESVELLHRWDATHSILKNDLVGLTMEMTRAGIKRAVEIASDEGLVTEEFAVGHILDYLADKNISQEGLEYAKKIALELMKKQSLSVCDIERLNPGAFSDVFEIGDYVLKIGHERTTKELPEHPRVLPSFLRFEVKKEDDEFGAFVEVQPKAVPASFVTSREEDENESELYSVFKDLRAQGILWGDAAKRNLGYVHIPVAPIRDLFSEIKIELDADEDVTIYHTVDATPLPVVSEDIFNPYLMVIDTDFLYSEEAVSSTPNISIPSCFSMELEERYKREALENQASFRAKRDKKVKDLTAQIEEIW